MDRRLFEVIKKHSSKLLPSISLDRIQSEVIKTIQSNPRKAIQSYLECDILSICYPSLINYLPRETPIFFSTSKLESEKQVFLYYFALGWN